MRCCGTGSLHFYGLGRSLTATNSLQVTSSLAQTLCFITKGHMGSRSLVQIASILCVLAPAGADAEGPPQLTQWVEFPEQVSHGLYQTCSIDMDTSFPDTACSSVTPRTSAIKVSITYTAKSHLETGVAVTGTSFCRTKPEPSKLATWTLQSLDLNLEKFWTLSDASSRTSDERVTALIRESETTGMVLQAVREDGLTEKFDVSAKPPSIPNIDLWRAKIISHAHCLDSLRPSPAH